MKKNILSFFFLFFLLPFSYAQVTELANLKTSLKTTKDSFKYVDVLNRMATLMYESNIDSTFYLANKAQKIAYRLGYEKGQADASNNLGIFCLINANYNVAMRYFKKANVLYKGMGDSVNYVNSTMYLAFVYISQANKKRAIEQMDAALLHSKKLQNDSIVSLVIANCLFSLPDRFKGKQKEEYIAEAERIALKHKMKTAPLILNLVKFDDLIKQNKRDEALALLHKSIDTAFKYKLYYSSMNMIMRMGYHLEKADPSLTAFYYKEALDIAQKHNFNSWKGLILTRLFHFYANHNDNATAIIYGKQLIALFVESEVRDNLTGIDYLDYTLKEEQANALAERSRFQIILLVLAAVICLMVVIILIVIRKALKRTRKLNKLVVSHNDQMKKALEALEESQRENTNLLKVVAHDLRGPVAGIYSLSAAMIVEPERSVSDQEMLMLIKNSSSDSLELVNNLLQLQFKSEAINKASVDLMNMLSHCVSILKPNAEAKAQQINLQVNHFTLLANREKLWRVFSNLITNAIKFSPRNTIIEVKTEEVKDHVRISVADEGIGIPVDMENQIFNMFTTARRQGTGGEESFGLGLAICKQIINAHDGKIWFERRAERGTTFIIELPYLN